MMIEMMMMMVIVDVDGGWRAAMMIAMLVDGGKDNGRIRRL